MFCFQSLRIILFSLMLSIDIPNLFNHDKTAPNINALFSHSGKLSRVDFIISKLNFQLSISSFNSCNFLSVDMLSLALSPCFSRESTPIYIF